MKRRLPVLILVAALIAAGAYFYPRLTNKAKPENQLTLSGNIEAHESLVSFKIQGRIIDLPVEEGQWVEHGTLLARLDDADYRQKVRIDEANVNVRESNLALTLAGTREQEVKASQQTMLDAQADLQQKKLDDDRALNLFSKEEISAQDRDRADTALKRSEAIFQAAQQRYNQAVEGSRKEDIAIARANLAEANANLGLSRVNLSYTILRAPSAGVITVRQAELGEVVVPGTPVVTLADLDHMWLRAYIAETDLGRIRWGQEATITTDTYPGKQYRGRISFISSSAEFTPKSVQTYKERVTLVYRIKIDVENPNHELKPGMPADAHVELAAASPDARQQETPPEK
ncbi:MAG TPA: HlyD family efflux transporter periplasmic adaptor subunit [Candidatus Dormibacteraeota bacterium]|nr:HlyD family efflux transporter periplasmic adaptor subunit [Candidatus Dormibacteraeota bacterium]